MLSENISDNGGASVGYSHQSNDNGVGDTCNIGVLGDLVEDTVDHRAEEQYQNDGEQPQDEHGVIGCAAGPKHSLCTVIGGILHPGENKGRCSGEECYNDGIHPGLAANLIVVEAVIGNRACHIEGDKQQAEGQVLEDGCLKGLDSQGPDAEVGIEEVVGGEDADIGHDRNDHAQQNTETQLLERHFYAQLCQIHAMFLAVALIKYNHAQDGKQTAGRGPQAKPHRLDLSHMHFVARCNQSQITYGTEQGAGDQATPEPQLALAIRHLCRLDNFLIDWRATYDQLESVKREGVVFWNRRRVAFFSVFLVASFLLGGLLHIINNRRLSFAPPEPPLCVERFRTVEEQYVFALQTGAVDAWKSVYEYFPGVDYWEVRAKKQLALVYVSENDVESAGSLFQELGGRTKSDVAVETFVLAGRSWLEAQRGNYSAAVSLLSELTVKPNLDHMTQYLVAKTRGIIQKRYEIDFRSAPVNDARQFETPTPYRPQYPRAKGAESGMARFRGGRQNDQTEDRSVKTP